MKWTTILWLFAEEGRSILFSLQPGFHGCCSGLDTSKNTCFTSVMSYAIIASGEQMEAFTDVLKFMRQPVFSNRITPTVA